MRRFESILVVDDEADLRDAVTTWLRSDGYQVLEAGHGAHALEVLAGQKRVHLIVLDLAMPVMDGPTFLTHKALGAHAEIPVVIFSSTPEDALHGVGGVVCTVRKLDGLECLSAAIRSAEGEWR